MNIIERGLANRWVNTLTADDTGEQLDSRMRTTDGRRARQQEDDICFLENITSRSRILIIEGISGAGKDTFQSYLKRRLKDRDVYDYSEGEVLHSWKQFQIEGILKLRIKFMKLFVNYTKDLLNRDEKAVFLLNRFHLSTYAWTKIQQEKLGREYNEIIGTLRQLPVHIFVLHVDPDEIENRSLHPERSSAWRKFQKQKVENFSFCDRLLKQQELILEAAEKQQIPYSVIKIPPYQPQIGERHLQTSEHPDMPRRSISRDRGDSRLAQTVQKNF
jgi:thymidylate kinase